MMGKSFKIRGLKNMKVINYKLAGIINHSLQDHQNCAFDDILMRGKSFTMYGMKNMEVINSQQKRIISHYEIIKAVHLMIL